MMDSGFLSSDAFALGKGLLYGYDSAFSLGFRELIRSAGVTHLVAASGANLGYVLLLPQRIVGQRHWFVYRLVSFLLIWIYWLVAEQSGSLWRAVGMWLVSFLASCFGRYSLANWSLLVWTAICAVWFRDLMLTHSYALSALAIIGLSFSRSNHSGEKNNSILKHSKNRIRTSVMKLGQLWFEGSAVFVAVEIYLWWCFQSFQPIGIYTTFFLQPFLPAYLVISGFLEFIGFVMLIAPGSLQAWANFGLRLFALFQQYLFQICYLVMSYMAKLSDEKLLSSGIQAALFYFLVIFVFRKWREWSQRQKLEKWREVIGITN